MLGSPEISDVAMEHGPEKRLGTKVEKHTVPKRNFWGKFLRLKSTNSVLTHESSKTELKLDIKFES